MHDQQVFDYSPARQRFLIVSRAGPGPKPKLVVVSDWRAALAREGAKP